MTLEVPFVGYVRQSKTRDRSESIETQQESNQATAERFGHPFLGNITEPPSTGAFKNRGRNRVEFPKLLAMLSNGEAGGVIVYKQDRLSRGGGPGWAPVFEAAEAGGLNLDRFVLTPTGYTSEFEISIRATMDREETKKLQERVRDAKVREAASGRPNVGGVRPFGYLADNVTVDEDERTLIIHAAEHLLTGGSLYRLVEDWAHAGIVAPGGKPWTATTLKRSLCNPRLWGLRTHKGKVVAQGVWEPVIDVATGERLLVRLNRHSRATNENSFRRTYLLTGLLYCGRCGMKLIARRRSDGVGSYICLKTSTTGACGKLRVVAPPLEAKVTDSVLTALEDGSFVGLLSDEVEQSSDTSALYEQAARCDEKLTELSEMWAADEVTKLEWFAAKRPLEERRSKILREIAEAEVTLTVPLASLAAVPESWHDLTLDQKRETLRFGVDRINVAPATRQGAPFEPDRVSIVWRH